MGLLFFGGLCVAASEFYKSKHNVILSAGIFFVSAGRSCPGAPPAWGDTGSRRGVWVLPGCQHREILSCESCSSPVGKSPQQGKTMQGLWPWSLCQAGAQPRRGSWGPPGAGGSALHPGHSAGTVAAAGPGRGAARAPHEITLWRGSSCWITHFSVLFPNASPDYRVTMSLSQGTALFCVFLLPTKRQMTLPPWLAGAADADEKTAERT